ncbi:hypothetical protein BDN70DRAFT_879707 [Pholiota conissans]|uniref:Uncharacterized protein n=1 Tax=Pholiota conissans TaxID=109636 RepID=A0A9P5Z2Q1_9AGAR|nr:hypothetical protein BDN70DRAFT_879707 [Pholiota conissans]
MTALRNRAEERAKYMPISISEDDIANVSGNAPSYLKEAALRWYIVLNGRPGFRGFGFVTRQRVRVTEVSLEPSVDDPEKISAKMVTELEVTPDMCNVDGILEQGCMCGLMDEARR